MMMMLVMSIQGILISAIVVLLTSKQVSCSGVFQIQPLVFLNEAGVDQTGNCCAGSRNRSGRCSAPCRTYFRICLSHYQSSLPPEVTCTFGRTKTRTLGNNSIYFANNSTIRIPFEFTWPGSFTLIVEAWHDTSASITNRISSQGSVDVLVYRIVILGTAEAGSGWRVYDNASSSAAGSSPHSFRFRLRVVCNETYFGPGCSDTCQPRDDKFGHYTCSRTGTKICQNGWRGQYCDKAVCLDGCHVTQGYCDDPYECKCRLGWQGKFCRQCIPYPGCQHGYCKSPWQCNCNEGWGGLFCNQDLNFCTNYQPCRNGGTCTNAGQGSYSCTCPPGFTGTNCEKETEDCIHIPCQNGGTCQLFQVSRRDQLRCSCLPSFYGSHCQWSVHRSCDLGPCLNNGSCKEHGSGQYHCLCRGDFTGINCETRVDACHSSPCLNGGRCVSTSGGSDFACICGNGNGGRRCEDDRDHCAGSPCLNGAACLPDRTNGFRCRCPAGYAGVLCQDDLDDCLDVRCSNGAACVDLVADFRCACAVGFSGRRCTDAVVTSPSSSCVTSPCRNAGTCVRYGAASARCLCTSGFRGEFCEIDDVTVETAPDKQVFGDVTSSSSSSVTIRQVVLIAVLGAGIPVIVLLAGVVLLIVKRRRALDDDVTVDNSNVRNDDVINCNRKRLADATVERPVKISNKERQQRMQSDRDRQEDVYAAVQQERFCDSKSHVTSTSDDRTLRDSNNGSGSGNRTHFRLDPASKEQPLAVEANESSRDAGKLQQSKRLQDYVLATEV